MKPTYVLMILSLLFSYSASLEAQSTKRGKRLAMRTSDSSMKKTRKKRLRKKRLLKRKYADKQNTWVRRNTDYSASLRYGAFVGAFGPGLDLAINKSETLQIGFLGTTATDNMADYINESLEQEGESYRYQKADLNSGMLGVYGRKFLTDTFSITGGLMRRTVEIDAVIDDSDFGSNPTDFSVEASSLTLMIQIGNRWAWESGFSIGCDWVGYLAPIAALDSKASIGIDDGNGKTYLEFGEEFTEEFAKSGNTQALMLDLGWLI